jgi:peptidoglycan hydrolase-like protein with peptidoglycan-binding domain
LAFVALTGVIIYNALYLQETRLAGVSSAGVTPVAVSAQELQQQAAAEAVPERALVAAPATTDLPPLPVQEGLEDEGIVKAVQRELTARGYDAGPADGSLGEATRKAIAAYETDNGLTVTRSPTEDLLRHILLGGSAKPAAATGSVAETPEAGAPKTNSATVKALQQVLADLGYAPGPIDGRPGQATAEAIAAFQRDRKIESNGHITPELLTEIKRVTGRSLTL